MATYRARTIMKKLLTAASITAFVIVSCCAPVKRTDQSSPIQTVGPKVEQVEKQAKITSANADTTVFYTKKVKEKYPTDADALAAQDSAIITADNSRETEAQLRILGVHAKVADDRAETLRKENLEQQESITKLGSTISKLQVEIKELKAKLFTKNALIISAGLIILILGSLILKPWRWF